MKDTNDALGAAIVIVIVMTMVIVLVLASRQKSTLSVEMPVQTIEKSDRFKISSQGSFNAGYSAHIREILIIKDTKTGKEYLGITGVGVTEIVGSGKSATEE